MSNELSDNSMVLCQYFPPQVRDPTQRLGAGPPGSVNDMQALRLHSFFSTIDWSTIWTAPAPSLEAGLVKKDSHPLSMGTDVNTWDDVGAAWDDMVDDGRDEDEISWASDAEDIAIDTFKLGTATSNVVRVAASGISRSYEGETVGPMGESRPLAPSPSVSVGSTGNDQIGRRTPRPLSTQCPNGTNGSSYAHSHSGSGAGVRFIEDSSRTSSEKRSKAQPSEDPPDSGTEADEDRDTVAATLDDIPTAVRTAPVDVPLQGNGIRDSCSTGSANSSSDSGSPPVGGIDATLNRGRNRAQTPIQGHGSLRDDEEWYVTQTIFLYIPRRTLKNYRATLLMPGETVVFNTTVEKSALRRRASRLLAIAGAPRRKPRELVLTDRRLICVKHKPGRTLQLSHELWLKSTDPEADFKMSIVSVEPKGEREIVVMTVSLSCIAELTENLKYLQSAKSYPYLTSSSSLTTTWLRKIREAMKAEAKGNSASQAQSAVKPPSPTSVLRT